MQESPAYQAGYKTISELTRARLKIVITEFNEITNNKLGYRTFRLDKSNFKKWQKLEASATPEQILKQLDLYIEHIEPEASAEELLFEVLLKAGYMPTEKVETLQLAGINVYSVANGQLLVCLANKVTRELMDAVVEIAPPQFVCLDSAFEGNDQLKANAVQTFTASNQECDKKNQIVFRTL